MTGVSTYSGATTVNNGTLSLKDQGQLTSTTSVAVNYGATLTLDNTNLYNVASRLNPAAPVSLTGGTISLLGAPAPIPARPSQR